MSATAERIEELREREAAYEQEAAERDSLDERLRATRENREQLESDLEGERRAARIAGQAAAENYAAAQQTMVEVLAQFVSAKAALGEAKALYKSWRSTAWSLETEIPVIDDLANQTIGSQSSYELRKLLDAYAEAIASPL